MAQRAEKSVPPVDETVHVKTGAKKATTPEAATPRPAPSVQQVLAAQKAPPSRQQPAPALSVPATTAPTTPTAAPRSADAMMRNLQDWASMPMTSITFDGNSGEYKANGSALPTGSTFIAIVPEARKGFIRFLGVGQQPDVRMTCVSEDVPALTRDDIPDGHAVTQGLDGIPREAWQEQLAIPLTDDGGEMYSFVARNKVSLIAAQALLGKFLFHPKAKQGMYPIIRLESASYLNKKFGTVKPKPVLKVVGWVNRDGDRSRDGNAPMPKAGATEAIFNDSVEF
jgi:hypothetical protein